MPIVKPKMTRTKAYIKDQEAKATPGDHTGKHELLRTSPIYHKVYDYIFRNPDCTTQEISYACETSWRRVSELKNEGLVYYSGKAGKFNKVRVVEGGDVGKSRDLLRIDLDIQINVKGEYWLRSAKLHGQVSTADWFPSLRILKKTITIRVPRRRERKDLNVEVNQDNTITIDISPESVKID